MDSRQKAHKSPKGAKTALFFACLASFFSLTLGLGGVTLAAYLNAVEAKENAILDFNDLSSYFASVEENDGERVFHLNTETHLQNLQRLVSIGLFGPSDTFVLDKDIDCAGTLYPIGTDDMPFDSAFNGNGHVISALHVICADGRDAGLFGYTSINSSVKNLILSAPKIEVTANSNDFNDDGKGISGSPIEATYGPLASLMPEINFVSQDNAAATGMINVKNGTQSGQTAVITGFPDSLSSGEAEVEILYESSDENLLTLTQTTNGYQAECKPNPESNAPNFDLYPVTVDAKAKYEVNGVFGYYVLERYQFNILGNGNVSTAVTEIDDPNEAVDENGSPAKITVHSGAFKTIHPDYDEHDLNVGFFIGHCDGSANHLGLYGGNDANSPGQHGTIVINSGSRVSAYSARTLIGKTRKDNPVDASAGDTMNIIYDYRGAINGTPDQNGLIHDFGRKVKDYEYGHDKFGYGYGFGSTIDNYSNNGSPEEPVTDSDSLKQQDNAETMTENVVTNPSMREYSSFYPGTNQTLADSTTEAYKPSSSNWEVGEYSDNADTAEPDPGSFNAQVIDGGLGAGTWTKLNEFIKQYWFLGTYTYHHQLRLTRGYNINNGFKIWSTKNLSPIFTENLFYINFHVSYVATRKKGTAENQNSFQILFNSYNPEVRGYDKWSLGDLVGYNPYPDEWTSSYLQYLFWQDLSNPQNVDFTDGGQLNALYNPADHPIIDDGKLHSDVITLTIDQQNGTWWSNAFQSIKNWWNNLWNGGSDEQTENREARYPMFAFGMGSNVGPNGGIYASEDHQSTANYYADLIYDENQQTYQNSRFVNSAVPGSTIADLRGTRLFDSDNGAYQTYAPSGSSEEGWVGTAFGSDNHYNDSVRGYYNNQERGYFNSYFKVENGTKLYIRDFQITFTNRLGNTEDIIYKVDFVPKTDLGFDENSQTWNAWPDDSNVQIGFNMDKTDGGVTFRFYRDNSNNVYGYYSNAAYELVNSGYDKATLALG